MKNECRRVAKRFQVCCGPGLGHAEFTVEKRKEEMPVRSRLACRRRARQTGSGEKPLQNLIFGGNLNGALLNAGAVEDGGRREFNRELGMQCPVTQGTSVILVM